MTHTHTHTPRVANTSYEPSTSQVGFGTSVPPLSRPCPVGQMRVARRACDGTRLSAMQKRGRDSWFRTFGVWPELKRCEWAVLDPGSLGPKVCRNQTRWRLQALLARAMIHPFPAQFQRRTLFGQNIHFLMIKGHLLRMKGNLLDIKIIYE